jgi:hypothetical protein
VNKRLVFYFLIALFLTDTVYSFFQHQAKTMDGDLAWNIVPASDVQLILDRPFGFEALFDGEVYINPNRYFCHKSLHVYMRNMPLCLHRFVQPIDAPYLAAAVFKTVLQFAMILLLAFGIYRINKKNKLVFALSLALIFPFFQTNGYQNYMGIIDPTITYTFFYAFPLLLLLIYFYPLFKLNFAGKLIKHRWVIYLFWIPLALIVSLSGPLNPGIVLIISLLFFVHLAKKAYFEKEELPFWKSLISHCKQTDRLVWFVLLPINVFCLYSLYIGRFNLSSHFNVFPTLELYKRIPSGLYYIFTQKLGNPLLYFALIFNFVLLKKYFKKGQVDKKVIVWFHYFLAFSVLYILLLPLGGYRIYRENVIRYDTFLPITLAAIFTFAISTVQLVLVCQKNKLIYRSFIVILLLIFILADTPKFSENKLEKRALNEIVIAKDSPVKLKTDVALFSWWKYTNPEESELNARLIYYWKITSKKVVYSNSLNNTTSD